MRTRLASLFGWIAVAAILVVSPSSAQQINLDGPVRAGELTLFPDIKDENAFYYVVDKPRLAEDERGRPQFSFLRYVENVRSGADEEEAREGEGGGIVHAVVTLSVTDEQLREAEQELRRLQPGGEIRGPVVFRSGTFGLVSAFTDTEGNLSKQVVGLGNAPLLDGEKAAVSMQLTKLGAKILWESFQTPTPDISFSFEMEVSGYRAPVEATIFAEWDRVYEHTSFGVGVASNILAAEIRGAFEDLTESRAIRVEQTGEDEKMETLLTTAYNKLLEMMFQPMGGSGTPNLASLTSGAGGRQSMLDRATNMYNQNQQRADRNNERIRRSNREATQRADTENRRRAEEAEEEREATDSERATDLLRQATRAERRAAQLRQSADRLAESDAESAAQFRQAAEGADNQASTLRRLAGEAETGAASQDEEVDRVEPDLQEEESAPPFAIVAAFEMKKVRHRGTFELSLNKRTTDTMTLRFDENIGDLRRLMGDEGHFRQANLDDPLYRQREIVAMVDGYNASDFGEFVNFVTVQMRKRHEGGEETYDEVRIDRDNFSREGNNFKLLYGWKGDENRRRWMDYDVRSTWSFFGGSEVESDWESTTSGAVNLAPPFQRRSVQLEADPDLIADAEVRSINVEIFYDLGDGEQTRQVTMNASRGELSERVDFLLPASELDYEYEITWRLRGNRSVSSGRQSASDAILFVDEVPEA